MSPTVLSEFEKDGNRFQVIQRARGDMEIVKVEPRIRTAWYVVRDISKDLVAGDKILIEACVQNVEGDIIQLDPIQPWDNVFISKDFY
jgi:hypothetical protein